MQINAKGFKKVEGMQRVLEGAERGHTGNSRESFARLERGREEQGRAGKCRNVLVAVWSAREVL